MDMVISYYKNSSTVMQALGVTVGGLIGVFATLAFFYFLIWGANKISKKD
jgi:hypothetical protein